MEKTKKKGKNPKAGAKGFFDTNTHFMRQIAFFAAKPRLTWTLTAF